MASCAYRKCRKGVPHSRLRLECQLGLNDRACLRTHTVGKVCTLKHSAVFSVAYSRKRSHAGWPKHRYDKVRRVRTHRRCPLLGRVSSLRAHNDRWRCVGEGPQIHTRVQTPPQGTSTCSRQTGRYTPQYSAVDLQAPLVAEGGSHWGCVRTRFLRGAHTSLEFPGGLRPHNRDSNISALGICAG
eukprot:1177044-Prorocentrum_minimum.AAC.4